MRTDQYNACRAPHRYSVLTPRHNLSQTQPVNATMLSTIMHISTICLYHESAAPTLRDASPLPSADQYGTGPITSKMALAISTPQRRSATPPGWHVECTHPISRRLTAGSGLQVTRPRQLTFTTRIVSPSRQRRLSMTKWY